MITTISILLKIEININYIMHIFYFITFQWEVPYQWGFKQNHILFFLYRNEKWYCYSWFYHTWLITYLWPSLSFCRLFRPHGLILYFDVSKFSPKNTILLLYMTFNPILACTCDFGPQTHVHRDVCINPNIFGVFLHVFLNHLTLGLPYASISLEFDPPLPLWSDI